jgi:arylamine N-acetyltransferase
MSDVGFGGDGATKPLPLIDGQVTHNSIGTQELRLVRDYIPNLAERYDDSRKLWIYQYRNRPDQEWNSFYSFPEFEFLEPDFEIMNYWTSSNPESFQTSTVLVVTFLKREEEKENKKEWEDGEDEDEQTGIYGKVMMVNGDVKRNLGGKTSVIKTCVTEEERVEALREYFGITLTDEERESIRGTKSELVP